MGSGQRYVSIYWWKSLCTIMHHTSPLGPQFHTVAPVLRSGENCQLISVRVTSTLNDTRAFAWPPRNATLAQDLVREVPVRRTISSIWLISNPFPWLQANHWSICLIIHLPKSSRTAVFSCLACIGRENTAPGFSVHENTTSPRSSGLREYE
jgi:hypothetical protein